MRQGFKYLWGFAACCMLLGASLFVSVAGAAAAEVHAFDATLSLTGGTTVSSFDPVPDPGPNHPPQQFGEVCGLAVDSAGDTYVASIGERLVEGGELVNGRIDIFDPEGKFLLEISNQNQPCDLAVDSQGQLYAVQFSDLNRGVVRYSPSEYPPTSTTVYAPPVTVEAGSGSHGIAVNRSNDHLFVTQGTRIIEYSSAAEGNAVVNSEIGKGLLNSVNGVAVDASTGDIYASSVCEGCPSIRPNKTSHVSVVYVFDSSGTLKATIDGAETPEGGFGAAFGRLWVAIDEATGEVFIDDVDAEKPGDPHNVYRFVPSGSDYEWVADPELDSHSYQSESRIAVANGDAVPTPDAVYVLSQGPPGHMYAFLPAESGPPVISESRLADAGTDEAELKALIDPNGAATRYRFEYVEAATYERDVEELGAGHGFDHAGIAGTGALPTGHQPIPVTAALEGLAPGAAYYFRVVATNCASGEAPVCTTKGEAVKFATYPQPTPQPDCGNAVFRVGLSANLPDCRAYELVTPPDTNGRGPTAIYVSLAGPVSFTTEIATEDGSGLLFMIPGGALSMSGGNGVQDGYEAVRTETGWQSHSAGPNGEQTQSPLSGGASPDHDYWFWATGSSTDHGNLVIGGERTNYVRLPDGTFELVGQGPLGTDPRAEGHWITQGAAHLILSSVVPLAEGASPAGVRTIYDRAPDGSLAIVSTEPSGEAPQSGTVDFQAANEEGDVAFEISKAGATTLYLHRAGGSTTAVASGEAITFAGLSDSGNRVTYLKGGDLFSFDATSAASQKIGFGGQSTVVNVSADGSHVYFVSPKQLLAGGPVSGKPNFYVWDSAANSLAFIGILTPTDVSGETFSEGNAYGLGQWVEGFAPGGNATAGPANDPSRTTPDGTAIVFESRAQLTGYDSKGHSEIYRYVSGTQPALTCVSCSPALLSPGSDAHLQLLTRSGRAALTNGHTPAHNLSEDGSRVFFETGDALVPADVDGTSDVYEWRASGSGQCTTPAGCLDLISSGHSGSPNFLYTVNASGHDVFFSTSDRLLPSDGDPTPSIYDARVDGGFPAPVDETCSGEACKGPLASPPALLVPGSDISGEAGRSGIKKCRKGQRKVHRAGKVKCVRRHHRRHHHRGKRPAHGTQNRYQGGGR